MTCQVATPPSPLIPHSQENVGRENDDNSKSTMGLGARRRLCAALWALTVLFLGGTPPGAHAQPSSLFGPPPVPAPVFISNCTENGHRRLSGAPDDPVLCVVAASVTTTGPPQLLSATVFTSASSSDWPTEPSYTYAARISSIAAAWDLSRSKGAFQVAPNFTVQFRSIFLKGVGLSIPAAGLGLDNLINLDAFDLAEGSRLELKGAVVQLPGCTSLYQLQTAICAASPPPPNLKASAAACFILLLLFHDAMHFLFAASFLGFWATNLQERGAHSRRPSVMNKKTRFQH